MCLQSLSNCCLMRVFLRRYETHHSPGYRHSPGHASPWHNLSSWWRVNLTGCLPTDGKGEIFCLYVSLFLHRLSFSVCLTLIFSLPLYATYLPQSICVWEMRFSRCPTLVNHPNKNSGIWQSVTGNMLLLTNDCSVFFVFQKSLSLSCLVNHQSFISYCFYHVIY